jgi:hypothetical protein
LLWKKGGWWKGRKEEEAHKSIGLACVSPWA